MKQIPMHKQPFTMRNQKMFIMKRLLSYFVFCITLFALQPATAQNTPKPKQVRKAAADTIKAAPTQYQYFVIKAEAGTYGYDVYANGNLYLHQPNIPGQPGNLGFADTTLAGKCARLAISKMRKGEMPPTITAEELRKLGIALPAAKKP
jgi:hypothetical protein